MRLQHPCCNHWTFFSAHGSGPGISFGFQGPNLMANSSFGSVWSDRACPASYRTGSLCQNGHLTRDSGQLREVCPQIRYLCKTLGPIGLVRVERGFCRLSWGLARNSGPSDRSGIPDPWTGPARPGNQNQTVARSETTQTDPNNPI